MLQFIIFFGFYIVHYLPRINKDIIIIIIIIFIIIIIIIIIITIIVIANVLHWTLTQGRESIYSSIYSVQKMGNLC